MPSFSSKDPLASRRLKTLGHLLTARLLVSALDLSRRHIAYEDLSGKKVVFVDSGGYEAMVHSRWAKALNVPWQPWTAAEQERTLTMLPMGPAYVVTSLDEPSPPSPAVQVDKARAFLARHSGFDVEFLMKPAAGLREITDQDIEVVSSQLDGFMTLGITEEDLGPSLEARVRRVAEVRRSLTRLGVDIPLHIFGCLNPTMVCLYTAAGADVFDGLGWTQHAFDFGAAIHLDDFTITYKDWPASEGRMHRDVDAMNLRVLDALQSALQAAEGRVDQEALAKAGLHRLPFHAMTELLQRVGVL